MDATTFWSAALVVVPMVVLLVVVVLLILDAGVTVPLRPLVRVCDGLALLFSLDATPACPHCGQPARELGRTAYGRWWYCPACGADPWRDGSREAQRKVMAS